jgi:UDP-N-acetylglucosamine acyltransferase
MVAGGAMVNQDVAPYTIVQGDRAKTVGINLVGLQRRGFSDEAIRTIKKAYKLVFRSRLRLEDALDKISQELDEGPELRVFTDFIRQSQRGIAR